jgi:hypothetical protein
LVEFGDERLRQSASLLANSFDSHGADLLGLRFTVTREPSLVRGQQNLERVDARRVRGHWHNCNDPSPEPGRCGIGGVITDDHCGAGFAGFRSAGRIEADHDDLAAAHSVA